MYYYGFFLNEIANFFPIQNDISCKLFSNSGLDSICSDCAWLCYKTYIQHHLLGKGRQQWTQKSWKQHFDQACWVINQTEIVKLASGIFFCIFCLLSGTSYLSEPTSTEAGTADKLFVSYFSELLAALWTSNWTLIFNANTRPVLFQNYSTPFLWFFKPLALVSLHLSLAMLTTYHIGQSPNLWTFDKNWNPALEILTLFFYPWDY